ncbi:isochorismatase family protein [Demequina zhanjiangensis]|uniref:Isochorismatase family protein n=1 Tax=Demequina zhanjiangensis TaxID=3051659 RepID=A0ABT8G3X7_9MICO|nr:isochorismatase family protein [Demequina sp. SYSU T00b26]MDN4473831.1 isochorismatase family protein [Demequina sp. SYSU T00b26]
MTAPRRALVIIDAQNEYFTGRLPIQYPPRDESLARILEAAEAADAAGIPVVVVQHDSGASAPVFAPGTDGYELHPALADRIAPEWKRVVKHHASVLVETGLDAWVAEQGIDTLTLAGYMTNNCVLGTSVDGATRGLRIEVLADATGAIDLRNDAGQADGRQVHETLLALLHSNWAAVASTEAWVSAARAGEPLPKSNLVASAAGS